MGQAKHNYHYHFSFCQTVRSQEIFGFKLDNCAGTRARTSVQLIKCKLFCNSHRLRNLQWVILCQLVSLFECGLQWSFYISLVSVREFLWEDIPSGREESEEEEEEERGWGIPWFPWPPNLPGRWVGSSSSSSSIFSPSSFSSSFSSSSWFPAGSFINTSRLLWANQIVRENFTSPYKQSMLKVKQIHWHWVPVGPWLWDYVKNYIQEHLSWPVLRADHKQYFHFNCFLAYISEVKQLVDLIGAFSLRPLSRT